VTDAHEDWLGTRVAFRLEEAKPGVTTLLFSHSGWPEKNQHWRVSCYCWAAYLRILRRCAEHGEDVPYEKRLDV
jgi:hypothetical protein